MARRLDARARDFPQTFAELIHSTRDADEDVSRAAADIIADVRARGDAALIELSARFDSATLTKETLRVPFAEIEAAYKSASQEVKGALAFAAARIEGMSRRPIVEMLIPLTLDDSLAPRDAHIASLFCQHFSYNLPDGRDWRQEKSRAID